MPAVEARTLPTLVVQHTVPDYEKKAAIKKKKLNVVKGGLATSVSFATIRLPDQIERMNFIREHWLGLVRKIRFVSLPCW